MTRWRALETGAGPGAWNMAVDAALLAEVERGTSPPTIRFYAWDPPAVSIGFHQPDPSPAEAARIAALGLEWVRRPTGGRAVYHGLREAELTYSVVAPLGAAGMPAAPSDCYHRIHTAIADGLARLGAPVELAGRRRVPLRPASRQACFAASVPGEILAGGRKLVGSAQRRSRRAFLQHGSIPLAGDQSALSEIWPGSLDPDRVTTVSAAAGRAIGFEEVSIALAAAFEAAIGYALEPGTFTLDEERRFDARSNAPALA
ncbi:MAG TPA: lipoate--protein ligase family protein [Gemmatimonadota bacterium]|nr:lipoate--protein ligase family protein [Gemmatimonadota bacterium]